MKLTEADCKRLLLDTNPNRNYNVSRGAMVLFMYHVEQLKYRDIADKLGIGLGTVSSSLRRAEHRLRVCWPLFADRDVRKLHDCESLRRHIWPTTTHH